MSQFYSTGELANLAGVSIRTVQYYDQRGILTPTALTEGGRRLYTDSDLEQLRIICFLRDLGFSIEQIRKVLAEENAAQVLLSQSWAQPSAGMLPPAHDRPPPMGFCSACSIALAWKILHLSFSWQGFVWMLCGKRAHSRAVLCQLYSVSPGCALGRSERDLHPITRLLTS